MLIPSKDKKVTGLLFDSQQQLVHLKDKNTQTQAEHRSL